MGVGGETGSVLPWDVHARTSPLTVSNFINFMYRKSQTDLSSWIVHVPSLHPFELLYFANNSGATEKYNKASFYCLYKSFIN